MIKYTFDCFSLLRESYNRMKAAYTNCLRVQPSQNTASRPKTTQPRKTSQLTRITYRSRTTTLSPTRRFDVEDLLDFLAGRLRRPSATRSPPI